LLLLRVIGWIVEAEDADVTQLSRRTMLGPAYVVDVASVLGHSEAAAFGNLEVPSERSGCCSNDQLEPVVFIDVRAELRGHCGGCR
jgi:hypothetical protein